jgi:hypothetical protein
VRGRDAGGVQDFGVAVGGVFEGRWGVDFSGSYLFESIGIAISFVPTGLGVDWVQATSPSLGAPARARRRAEEKNSGPLLQGSISRGSGPGLPASPLIPLLEEWNQPDGGWLIPRLLPILSPKRGKGSREGT